MPEALPVRPVRREVNLFDPSLWQVPRRPLAAWWPMAGGVAALLVCVTLSLIQSQEQARLTQQLEAVRAASSDSQEAPAAMSPEQEAGLRAQAEQLHEQVLRLRGAQQAYAVSTFLDALAQATLDGVWLTRIRIDRDAGKVQLEGHTRDARLISDYLASLARQTPFAGMAVRKVAVKPRTAAEGAAPEGFEFAIESEPAEGGSAPVVAPVQGAS